MCKHQYLFVDRRCLVPYASSIEACASSRRFQPFGTLWLCMQVVPVPRAKAPSPRPTPKPHPKPHAAPHSPPHAKPHAKPHSKPHPRPHPKPHAKPHPKPTKEVRSFFCCGRHFVLMRCNCHHICCAANAYKSRHNRVSARDQHARTGLQKGAGEDVQHRHEERSSREAVLHTSRHQVRSPALRCSSIMRQCPCALARMTTGQCSPR